MRPASRALSAAMAGLSLLVAPVQARAQPQAGASTAAAAARPASGVSGVVVDEQDRPLAGARVSVLGAAAAMALTDASGRFAVRELPPGEYSLRAHLDGFAASPRASVRLGSAGPAPLTLRLARLETPVATTGAEPLSARPIVAAGFSLPSVDAPPEDSSEAEPDHSHTDTAWRLRHLGRSVLKDSASTLPIEADEPPAGRAGRSPAAFASALLADLPFSGEVNLLTSSAFAPGSLFGGNTLPRGIAYLSIGAPTGAGTWAARAAMSQGDLSSWLVAGSFLSRRDALHSYDIGLSYSTQEYQGGNPLALAAVTDGSRNVGEVSVVDRWTPGPGVSFEYGGRYARYDYLARPGLFSPRAGLTLEPTRRIRLTAVLAQRMMAPGAEEFLPPSLAGPWIPPERTFSALGPGGFRVERARSLDVLFEHTFAGEYVVGVRRFFQGVTDQGVTVFGLRTAAAPRSTGHYYVASAGGVDAEGWGIRFGTPANRRVRGSIEYAMTHGRWNARNGLGPAQPWAVTLTRSDMEEIHDLTASFSADIPETATRVFILYKVNSAFARPGASLAEAGGDARFDVQVNQALPFMLAGTRWEVLVGVRNLFRDPSNPASVYDELLVVSPPKRVVGGFLVRF